MPRVRFRANSGPAGWAASSAIQSLPASSAKRNRGGCTRRCTCPNSWDYRDAHCRIGHFSEDVHMRERSQSSPGWLTPSNSRVSGCGVGSFMTQLIIGNRRNCVWFLASTTHPPPTQVRRYLTWWLSQSCAHPPLTWTRETRRGGSARRPLRPARRCSRAPGSAPARASAPSSWAHRS